MVNHNLIKREVDTLGQDLTELGEGVMPESLAEGVSQGIGPPDNAYRRPFI